MYQSPVSQRESPVIREPLGAHLQGSRDQHIKPKLSTQPVVLRLGTAIGFKYRSIQIRKSRIGKVHSDMNASVAMSPVKQARFVGNKDSITEVLLLRNRITIDFSDLRA